MVLGLLTQLLPVVSTSRSGTLANSFRVVVQGRSEHLNSDRQGLFVDDGKLLDVLELNPNGDGLDSIKASEQENNANEHPDQMPGMRV